MNAYKVKYAEVKEITVYAKTEEAAKNKFFGENVKDLVSQRGIIEVLETKKLD